MKTEQEDFILKKIRYFQGTVEDFSNFWKRKCEEGLSEESEGTKSLKKKNDDLNKAYRIIPVEREDDEE
jgi:hypothetical protein